MPACPRCRVETAEGLKPGEICTDCATKEAADIAGALHYRPRIHLTNALILANVLVFLAMLAQGARYARGIGNVFLPHFSPQQLLLWGANWGPASLTSEPWRLWSSNYLHGSLTHIATNMFCLWGLGRLTESFYPKTDFLLAYTFTGICGSLLSVLVGPVSVPSVGASGAVFGLAGVMIATMKWGHIPLPADLRNTIYKDVMRFAALNIVIGVFIPHVDNMGHLGGFLSGVLVGGVMGRNLAPDAEHRDFRRRAWLFLGLFLIAAVYGTMRLHHRLIYNLFNMR